MIAKRGWKVSFGRVLTPEEFATLRDKLTALKAIAGNHNVDYSSPDLLYINVMNPSEPAVGYKSRQPVAASPSPGATPKPAPIPTPGPCKDTLSRSSSSYSECTSACFLLSRFRSRTHAEH